MNYNSAKTNVPVSIYRVLARLLFSGMVIILLVASTANASSESFYQELEKRHDWLVEISVEKKPQYLRYQGSTLHPITNLRLAYRNIGRKPGSISDEKLLPYEDIWYHKGRVLGSRRYRPLALNRKGIGIIVVNDSKDSRQEPLAIAHAITTLTVDLGLERMNYSGFIVPQALFDSVVSELANYQFHTIDEDEWQEGRQTSISLYSYPGGMETDLYYRK